MSKMLSPGVTVRTTDGIVTTQPAWLCCTIVTVAASGDYVDVYEGRDPTSGRKLFRLKCLLNRSVSFNFTHPVFCERGIYLDFSTTGSECSVFWSPDDDVEESPN